MVCEGDRKHSKVLLTISIVIYDNKESEIISLIDSILCAIEPVIVEKPDSSYSIFLVNNSEYKLPFFSIYQDFSLRLKKQRCELNLIEGHGNIGFGRGHNIVLSQTESDYHLILNPDIYIDYKCLIHGLKFLNRHDDICLISPKARNQYGEEQFLCKTYPSVFTLLLRAISIRPLELMFADRLKEYEMRDMVHSVEQGKGVDSITITSGCFMLCKSGPLYEIGGFDEKYFLYFEDFDLSIRLSKRYKLAFVPDMKIVHRGGFAAKKGVWHIGMFIRSGIRFFNTHGWRWFKQ